jgi:GH25 family lysozyme M1 (1,4-beta-N-acetylmuramidase)
MKYTNKITITLGIVAAMSLSFGTGSARANNLFGIDVSSFQGSINWASVHADGAVFAFAKATEGTSITDTDFTANMTHGKAAGMQMGAYHFPHPDMDCPSAEANHFWSVAGAYILADGKSISPAIDFEGTGTPACQTTYNGWYNKFNSLVKGKTTSSLNCVIIVSACSACNLSGTTLAPWILNYNGENLYTGGPWSVCCSCDVWDVAGKCNVWDYWGVTSTGAISGISGNVDFDAYNGSLLQLKSQQGVGGI